MAHRFIMPIPVRDTEDFSLVLLVEFRIKYPWHGNRNPMYYTLDFSDSSIDIVNLFRITPGLCLEDSHPNLQAPMSS
ncbi:hypothetical protein CEXT_731681 [Caerostris extrusa]|uniref:Uncharacterized protein n=1 Tax=Caerostris extrusa TaxID=172846 RepID=A0AAV4R9V8_CAEEX|nr:hypothetical protein CEXT_731681 [Caerostris extrusa]